ncbi:MAG: NAD-dependent epimerase/dehydratase family protein [Actinobacteria bacterium]|nr:NAD-dependent epimerase/dehydratase family protein [Actinomycetota bacterium]MBM3714045.1 NAD-dependent epimerase/dehydratase family protein [Actinomycetota bacterium]
MNILVTGGAGFIGSHICEKLVSCGSNIICIDNFNDYYNPHIKENNISALMENQSVLFTLYREDILNTHALDEIFSKHKIDIVIHLAARAGVRPSINNASLYEQVNVQGTINLLDACRQYSVEKFIFASSSSVYGGNIKIPFSEKDIVDNPVSPYAATKKAAELICYTYFHLFHISISVYRFFTVYGPRQRPEMAIHKFTRRILNNKEIYVYGDGSTSRDYTYIDDITDVILNNLENIKGFEIFNLGNSNPVKISDLINTIEKITAKKAAVNYIDPQAGDMKSTCADILKARKMLKYNPKISIEEGVKKFVEWYIETKNKNKLFEEQ